MCCFHSDCEVCSAFLHTLHVNSCIAAATCKLQIFANHSSTNSFTHENVGFFSKNYEILTQRKNICSQFAIIRVSGFDRCVSPPRYKTFPDHSYVYTFLLHRKEMYLEHQSDTRYILQHMGPEKIIQNWRRQRKHIVE